MVYLSINNKNYENIVINSSKKYTYNLKYITPYIVLYGITFRIDVKEYNILEKNIIVEIDKSTYDELISFDNYISSKLNNYRGIAFSKNNKYYIKLNNNNKILLKMNNDVLFLWISKIKNKNYINYPIIYII